MWRTRSRWTTTSSGIDARNSPRLPTARSLRTCGSLPVSRGADAMLDRQPAALPATGPDPRAGTAFMGRLFQGLMVIAAVEVAGCAAAAPVGMDRLLPPAWRDGRLHHGDAVPRERRECIPTAFRWRAGNRGLGCSAAISWSGPRWGRFTCCRRFSGNSRHHTWSTHFSGSYLR